jgi:hypothetical protein
MTPEQRKQAIAAMVEAHPGLAALIPSAPGVPRAHHATPRIEGSGVGLSPNALHLLAEKRGRKTGR